MYDVPTQTGRRIVVTGANSGTGREATRRLAKAGASVVMAVRSLQKGQAAREEILRETPTASLELREVDLADLDSVRACAAGIIDDGRPVHALVNNAGVMTPPDRLLTKQGHELQWGSNVLGPFALMNLLLPTLLQADQPRVVTMSSGMAAFGRINIRDLESERSYRPEAAYAQSKLANLLMGMHLARVARERRWSLVSTMAHPGYTRTNLQAAGAALGSGRPTLMSRFTSRFDVVPSQDVETGAEPLLFATADPAAQNGAFYGPSGRFGMVGPSRRASIYRSAAGPSHAASLWAICAAQTGTDLPAGE